MFKFLRRYSKWILAIGGTLLMVTFLVPFAIQNLGQTAAARGATWATVGDDKDSVSLYDYQRLQQEQRVVELLNPGLIFPVSVDSAQHWFLLTREAEAAGLVGGTDDAYGLLGESPNETLRAIAVQTGNQPQFVLETMAKYRGVMRLVSMFRSAAHFSDRRLRAEAKHMFHTVNAKFVVIEASADAVTEEPTEEEIAAHYAKFADKLPGEGERGFGYKLPNRVKLEWIAIPAASVRSAIEASPEFNDIALRKHWRRNPGFTFPEITEGAPVPEMVKEDLKATLFRDKMEEISRMATDELRAATRGLQRSGAYFVLPEDWDQKRMQLPALAEKLQREFNIPLPTYTAIGDRWLSTSDVAALEGVGSATTDRFGTAPMPLSLIVAQAKEFGEAADAIVQKGVAGPPLHGADGSLYVFRITDADASRKAADVNEVRDLVVRDLKRIADYDNLVATQTAYETEAEKVGLLALVVDNPRASFFPPQNVTLAPLDTLLLQAQLGMGLNAQPSSLPVVGRDKDVVSAIVDYAMRLPMLPINDISPEQKIFTVTSDEKLALLIVEVNDNRPLTRENYVRGVDFGVTQLLLLNDELDDGEAIKEAFSFKTMAKRNNFELSRTEEEAAEDAATTTDTVANAE